MSQADPSYIYNLFILGTYANVPATGFGSAEFLAESEAKTFIPPFNVMLPLTVKF